ncbi:ATP-dependent Clp protease adaptor ClpS [Chryseobacterium wangxinyae]|jgi:ATP-dependent Clp protease adaptor protein ClpS|uniref:ATP-dependent Clp protease adapter protein ClpS n=1 Tax=Chryseobacterium aquaeductus TaxID=2675056 RepID=A0A9N8MHU1_9FLAO|nr:MULTISPECIES: ATP-dependent Clp protease adaptor ClpS [Chryseobacterium]MDF2930735.1 ATP-dependent Clp protease adaptor ClpS [Chryseobacterium sp.]CAA7332064.1 ATP-dependent Clp protease adapter protein ClpS [Chryseobacterium potabilaquae]AYN02221.1 ATP-dependent Clp protease adaptor ClpS [Chryseobacterium sp. 3008163]MCI3935968.1 ATP-dependent Clp protease adaptor ClpS [Chryseobacterium aahli]MCY0978560.1 ATP-dependent Clp protease adaptor ClpS [Chryseobacterium sp. CY350]
MIFYNSIKDYENPKRQYEEEVLVLDETDEVYKLILHNDDIHTFDDVIEALIEICKHDLIQAEQCTMLVHYKGKCTVKTGSMDVLKPMHEKLISRSLTSEIV